MGVIDFLILFEWRSVESFLSVVRVLCGWGILVVCKLFLIKILYVIFVLIKYILKFFVILKLS